MHSVLVVDDHRTTTKLLTRWLQASGYNARAAATAEEALDAMVSEPATVAVCDMLLPGHDGLWLAGQLRERFPDTAIIMMTGVWDAVTIAASVRMGIIECLLKPFERQQLEEAVARGIECHQERVKFQHRFETLEAEIAASRAQVAEAFAETEMTATAALEAMLAMLTVRDRNAYDHAHRVARLAVNLALTLGITEPDLSDIERAALLHDIGKIAFPEALLSKPAPLTTGEWELIYKHPQIGHTILKHAPFLARAAEIVMASDEQYDPLGSPNTLRSEAPLGSHILAVANAYDAMTNATSYRDPLTPAEALAELRQLTGTRFDHGVVDALFVLLEGQVT